MSGLRILMLSDYFPPHAGGGVERVVSELCSGLARRGHRVAVLTLRTRPAPVRETDGDFTVVRVPARDLTGSLGFQCAFSAGLPFALRGEVRAFRPDIVHAHNLFFRTSEVAALPWPGLRGAPLVTTLHLGRFEGGSFLLRGLVRGYEATFGRLIIRRSAHIMAVSEAVAAHARRAGGGRVPVTTVPNGVDLGRFRPGPFGRPSSSQTVLFVGRLVQNKGPDVLLRSAPRVLSRHPRARFDLVGEGPMRPRLEGLAETLGIADSVRFLGLRDDVDERMRRASVFVRPSHVEGMPLTVLEAMACGLPVVATPVGGTPELIRDGENGHLVPVDDTDALAESVMSVLDSPQRARELGRRARATVEEGHGWDGVVERTEAVYEQVLAQ